jgi:hypothetical protein
MFSIIPYDQTTIKTVTRFRVDVNNIILFSSANLGVVLFDENNICVNSFPLIISGDEYANWGGNDEYIGQLIADKLGFTLSSASTTSPTFNISSIETSTEPSIEPSSPTSITEIVSS